MRRVALLLMVLASVPWQPAAAAPEDGSARCQGRRATIVGTDRGERLRGTRRRDVIVARGGRDVIVGGGGSDVVCAGAGRDRVQTGDGDDHVGGGGGADLLDGDDGDDTIVGGPGADRCFQGWGRGRTRGCVPVVAAAGDIACDPDDGDFNDTRGSERRCRMRMTSELLLRTNLAAVLALGDTQYPSGAPEDYAASYDPTWGRVRPITRPVPGNHEYAGGTGAAGYFGYFGAAAGDPSRGYYSFDIGRWHLVGLNTGADCAHVGGCAAGSPQQRWLVQDLAADPSPCTLAYWHEPRFTSSGANDPKVSAFWDALYADRAEIVLNGHAHVYERFARQTPAAAASPAGIRQFTVGTGGKDLRVFDGLAANSEVRSGQSFGVLELALAPNGYSWRFVPEEGDPTPFTDSGSGTCR